MPNDTNLNNIIRFERVSKIFELEHSPALSDINFEIKRNGQEIEIYYHCEQKAPNTVLNAALVERGIENQATSGENAGKLLKHDNVVREFKTILMSDEEGVVRLSAPITDNIRRFSIIVFMQNTDDMRIIAAEGQDI